MSRFGLVLAGGASRRMGVDKAALDIGGVPLLRHVLSVVQSVPGIGEVAVVGGRNRSFPGMESTTFVVDEWPGEGPLGGLVSGLRYVSTQHGASASVVVVSCDLPCLRADALLELVEALESPGETVSHDAVVSLLDGRRQPLHGAYMSRSVEVLTESFEAGNRRLEAALAGLGVSELPDILGSCRDADTPEEWAKLVPKSADLQKRSDKGVTFRPYE